MKKKLIAILCVCAVLGVTGCSKKNNTEADTNSATAKSAVESKELKAAQTQVDELEQKLTNMANAFSEMTGISAEDLLNGDVEDFDFNEEVHEVYDDTAVLEAYKSGDSSKLTDEKDKYILEQAEKAVKDIIKDGMTDYEKELAVYDYVFNGTHFDDSSLAPIDESGEYSHTPYGFFHDHSTICVGNATTFKLFMDMLGIDCQIIHSTEEGEHAWNIVKIDGDWYHVDVTFDGGDDKPVYSRFNVTDDVKKTDGYPWNADDFPACTSVKYCYIVNNAVECSDVYKIPELLKSAIDKKEDCVYLKLPVPEGADAEAFEAQLNYIANSIESNNMSIDCSNTIISDDNKTITASFTIYTYDDDDDFPDIDNSLTLADIDYDKLIKAFDDAFDGEASLPASIGEDEDANVSENISDNIDYIESTISIDE